eukprot:365034-Chlamydomonas_euryale.AAC.5
MQLCKRRGVIRTAPSVPRRVRCAAAFAVDGGVSSALRSSPPLRALVDDEAGVVVVGRRLLRRG